MSLPPFLKRWLPDAVLTAIKMNVKHRRLIYGMPYSAIDHIVAAWSAVSNGYGYNRSLTEGKCVDEKGDPIPWIDCAPSCRQIAT